MRNFVANAVKSVPFSSIREMSILAAKYPEAISLGIGEPDFNTPESICRAALEDALKGATHYTSSQGEPDLLKALADYTASRTGLDLTPKNMVVTAGGMGALTAIFITFLEPGEEVLIPQPCFPAYISQVLWAGGKPVGVPSTFENGFAPRLEDLEAAVTSKTKALLINSPNNPTGMMFPEAALKEMADFAERHDLLIISDEVYERMLLDGQPPLTIAATRKAFERTVVIHSFSKSFAMTGWRIGYVFGPEDLIGPLTKVVSSTTSCTSSVSQRAAFAALNRDQMIFDNMVESFRSRRDLVCDRLSKMDGIRFHKPGGAFYVFPDFGRYTEDSRSFAIDLLDGEQVVVVPGRAFGASYGSFVRISLTVNQTLLNEAMDRIERFVRK
jgi:aspartate/methionine/tyrosine aminotransferase